MPVNRAAHREAKTERLTTYTYLYTYSGNTIAISLSPLRAVNVRTDTATENVCRNSYSYNNNNNNCTIIITNDSFSGRPSVKRFPHAIRPLSFLSCLVLSVTLVYYTTLLITTDVVAKKTH